MEVWKLSLPNPSKSHVTEVAKVFAAEDGLERIASFTSILMKSEGWQRWINHVSAHHGPIALGAVLNTLLLTDRLLGSSEETKAIERTALFSALASIVSSYSGNAGDGFARIPRKLVEEAAELVDGGI